MKFTELSLDEYKKIRKLLLIGSEENKDEVYRDSKGVATIGIGINIQRDFAIWRKFLLYYFFGVIPTYDNFPFLPFDHKDEHQLIKIIVSHLKDRENFTAKEQHKEYKKGSLKFKSKDF